MKMSNFIVVFFIVFAIFPVKPSLATNSYCPKFDTTTCSSGLPGAIDIGDSRWIATYNGAIPPLSKQYCIDYCKVTPDCVFWTYMEKTDKKSGFCFMYDFEGCSSFTLAGATILPFITNPDNATYTHTTGMLCNEVGNAPPPPAAAIIGDPHFTGADNSHFDFTGKPDNNYCILSDSHLHINAYYGGRFDQWGDNKHKPLTWIRQLGILWGHHSILLMARNGPEWRYGQGYMQRIEVDGEQVLLSQAGDSASFADGKIRLVWTKAKFRSGEDEVDEYEVKIAGVLTMRVTLRPEVAHLRTAEDGVVHMSMELTRVQLSGNAHGVLGQTYRADHLTRLNKQKLVFNKQLNMDVVPGENAEGFIDGKPALYLTSGLLVPDCSYARFSRARFIDRETSHAIESSSMEVGSVSSALNRKLLL